MRELDCEESWVPKNWCFWTVVLEKTLESPLDRKEIQPVHSGGDQPWVSFGRNDAKPETPVLWPPHVKSWLIGKDSGVGRDWGQEEKGMTEDKMAGWHHWLNGHEFEWTPGDGDGQGGLRAVIHGVTKSWTWLSDRTKQLNHSVGGFSCDSVGKELACSVGDLGSIPGLGRSPEAGKGYPPQYSGLENSMNSPWDRKESDMTEQLWLSFSPLRWPYRFYLYY